jgi:hypothetical protein
MNFLKVIKVLLTKNYQTLSTAIATPIPPPIQRVARPLSALSRSMPCRSVTKILAPEAPIG